METKKFLASVVGLAFAANLVLSTVAFAVTTATGTGSADITNAGGYGLSLDRTTLSFVKDADNSITSGTPASCGNGGALDITLNAYAACVNFVTGNPLPIITVTDLAGSSTDRTLQFSVNQALTSGTQSLALSGFTTIVEAATNIGYAAGGAVNTNFASVTPTDKNSPVAGSSYTMVTWDKSVSSYLSFEAAVEFSIQQTIPAASTGLQAGTYTNTVTVTAG